MNDVDSFRWTFPYLSHLSDLAWLIQISRLEALLDLQCFHTRHVESIDFYGVSSGRGVHQHWECLPLFTMNILVNYGKLIGVLVVWLGFFSASCHGRGKNDHGCHIFSVFQLKSAPFHRCPFASVEGLRGGCLPKRRRLHFNQQKRCQKKDVGKHMWGGEMNQQKLNQHESTIADSTFSVTFFTQSHRLGESSGWDHGGPCHLMVLREASCEGLILGAEVLGTQSMKSRHRLRWWSYHSINQWTNGWSHKKMIVLLMYIQYPSAVWFLFWSAA